jgi:cytoskeleton protein RodZ
MSITTGQKLRQAREERTLTLEQVAQATRIRVHYLRALEAGEFNTLPSLAQARGFVRAYAGFLGLDGEALLAGSENGNPPTSLDIAISSARRSPKESQSPPNPTLPETQPASSTGADPTNNAADTAKPPESEISAPVGPAPAAISPIERSDGTPVERSDGTPVERSDGTPASPASSPAPLSIPAPQTTARDLSQAELARPFIEIGQQLKRQRELLGLSLEEVERHTHLRQHYLQFLESGDLDGLPSPVQGRGMLNNYATFLGLDPDPVLLRFAEGLQNRLAARKGLAIPDKASLTGGDQSAAVVKPAVNRPFLPAPIRRIFSADVLIGSILVVFLVLFIAWSAIRIFGMQTEQTPTSTAPSIADVLLATATPTTSPTPVPVTPTSIFSSGLQPPGTDSLTGGQLPANIQGKVQIYVSVRQRAWMRITVDGNVEFEGRVIPGSAYTFVGNTQVEILTGNGAALQVYFNQRDLGVLGTFGQVVNRIYTLQGVLNPTPTITPTGAPTIPVTITPEATLPYAPTTAPALP